MLDAIISVFAEQSAYHFTAVIVGSLCGYLLTVKRRSVLALGLLSLWVVAATIGLSVSDTQPVETRRELLGWGLLVCAVWTLIGFMVGTVVARRRLAANRHGPPDGPRNFQEQVRTEEDVDPRVQRGQASWAYIYISLGFVLTIGLGAIALIEPLEWPQKIIAYAGFTFIAAFLWLFSGWFQNKLIGLKERYENRRQNTTGTLFDFVSVIFIVILTGICLAASSPQEREVYPSPFPSSSEVDGLRGTEGLSQSAPTALPEVPPVSSYHYVTLPDGRIIETPVTISREQVFEDYGFGQDGEANPVPTDPER